LDEVFRGAKERGMYRFSRSIYRELAPHIEERDGVESATAARQDLLRACEATIRRLAGDRRYFARPAKTLFTEVRELFALSDQVYVYMVIERYTDLAIDFLESLPDDVSLDGSPRNCLASTRKGTPCQREPLSGRDYCPSHKHLEEAFDAFEEVGAAA
jgi:hypothetical protein